MSVVYQGAPVETEARTVAEFLAERGIAAARSIVEYDGEVYPPGEDFALIDLRDGAPLDVFRLTAGG